MPKRTQAYLDERRQRLLKAADRCFMRKGYHATSIGDICKAAQVSIATIYKYFPGKREIFLATHEEAWERMLAENLFESWQPMKQRYLDSTRNLDDARVKANNRITLELSSEALFDANLVRLARPRAAKWHVLLAETLRKLTARGEIDLPLGIESTGRMLQCLIIGLATARPWLDVQSPQILAEDLGRMLDLMVGAKTGKRKRSHAKRSRVV